MSARIMWWIVAAIWVISPATYAQETAETSQPQTSSLKSQASSLKPQISLHGAAQVWWQWAERDKKQNWPGVDQFQTRRLELGLTGQPAERADFALTLSMAQGNTLGVRVYEAWMNYRFSEAWSLELGYFLPPWTLTMSLPVSDLDFIRYPLIVDSGNWLFTPWQQMGLLLRLTPGEHLFFAVGIMNGLDAARMAQDNNNMKDTVVVGAIEALPGLRLHFGHWGGRTELARIRLAPGAFAALPFGLSTTNTTALPLIVGRGVVDHQSTWAGLEFQRGPFVLQTEALWNQSDRDGQTLRNSQGWHLSMIYTRAKHQALLRYEQFDPDTSDTGTGLHDEMEWTTLGYNYQLTPDCRFMTNYLVKVERLENQTANNEFVVQVALDF